MAIQQLKLFAIRTKKHIYVLTDQRTKLPIRTVSNALKAYKFVTGQDATIYWPGTEPGEVGKPIGSYDTILRHINKHGHIRVIRQKPGDKAENILIQKLPLE